MVDTTIGIFGRDDGLRTISGHETTVSVSSVALLSNGKRLKLSGTSAWEFRSIVSSWLRLDSR